jgi:glycosyltransferase involved in cell wall biosynthesis
VRIVLLNQFYPPDVAPTGRYLHDLACALVANGHTVTVIASRHAYGGGGDFEAREELDGVQVIRLSGSGFGRESYLGKLADYTAYITGLARELARQTRPDLVVALTTPPFLGLLAKLIADARKARHAHWVMDLYPDAMQAHGIVRDALAYKALQALARRGFAGASTVLTLGPVMAERVRRYVSGSTCVEWVPLWTLDGIAPASEAACAALRAQRGWEPERTVLLYSGNLGLGHRFDEFLGAARDLGPTGPRWVFSGNGRGRPIVGRFVAENPGLPVSLLPHVPNEDLAAHLGSADVHLASVDPSWDGLILPSKVQGSFAVGRPVLFVGSAEHEIARWVKESQGGWHVLPDDAKGLARLVRNLSPAERRERGQLARKFAQERFDAKQNIARVAEHLIASPPT